MNVYKILTAGQPKVRFYQGLEGIREIFEDMLRVPNQNIYAVLDLENSWTFTKPGYSEYVSEFIKRRAEKNIWWLGIMNMSEFTKNELPKRPWIKREVRMLEGINLPAEISITAFWLQQTGGPSSSQV